MAGLGISFSKVYAFVSARRSLTLGGGDGCPRTPASDLKTSEFVRGTYACYCFLSHCMYLVHPTEHNGMSPRPPYNHLRPEGPTPGQSCPARHRMQDRRIGPLSPSWQGKHQELNMLSNYSKLKLLVYIKTRYTPASLISRKILCQAHA